MLNLIFDFDGVLADTYEAAIVGRMQVSGFATREDAIADMNSYFSKKPYHTREHSLTDEQLIETSAWVSNYGKFLHEHGFSLFTDFVHEIENLRNVRKAIVSSGSRNYVIPALETTKINPTHILAYEDHHSKEEKIELICRDWGIQHDQVYYFTDTLADVLELQELITKDKLIGVSWGYCSKEQLLEQLDEEQVLDTPDDINRVLAKVSTS